MPLYEYQCKGCGHQFEDLVLGSITPSCPSCDSQTLERLLSVFAVSGSNEDLAPAMGACGSCGDPRGPGACSMN